MEKPQNETTQTSGHKYILNKPMFVLTAVIGAIFAIGGALAGFYIQGGHILLLIHLGEITTVSGITIGALLFSYRSTAFKPWLVPFGVGVPEEEVIVKKGDVIKFCTGKEFEGTRERVYMNYDNFPRDVNPGERILLDDGKLIFKVVETGCSLGRAHWGLAKYLFGKPGVLRRIFPAWLSYFKPGFHPWNHDDRALIGKYEGDYQDALLPA